MKIGQRVMKMDKAEMDREDAFERMRDRCEALVRNLCHPGPAYTNRYAASPEVIRAAREAVTIPQPQCLECEREIEWGESLCPKCNVKLHGTGE